MIVGKGLAFEPNENTFTLIYDPKDFSLQDAFDSLDASLREDLSEEQGEQVRGLLQEMTPDALEAVMLHLYESILLTLAQPRDREDDSQPQNFP